MRIIFFGSDDFAAVHLQELSKRGHQVLCCVTVPDKPQGRGMKLGVSPIKQMAVDRSVPCLQPLSLKEAGVVEALKSYGADIFVVVAYGRLLTQQILDIPKILCLNVHGSLLPRYRGAAPVNWAILNGDTQTGVTVQKMALALDAGDIIAQQPMSIVEDENAGRLRERMAEVGARLLGDVLEHASKAGFPLTPQDETKVTYAPRLTREMGLINWNKPARTIVNQVRGLQPWPGAFTGHNGKMLKITQAQAAAGGKGSPGEVTGLGRDGFLITCLDGSVLVKEVQPEAGKVMPAGSFTAGHKLVSGTIFT
jgi:methionyl-tRNA formyltransferase